MQGQCGMKMRARRLKPIVPTPSMMKVLIPMLDVARGKPYENTLTVAQKSSVLFREY